MTSYSEATLEASQDIIWDCPNCGSDDADFRRHGVLAGKAICKKCKHSWKWQKSKSTFEITDNTKTSVNKMKKSKGKEPMHSLFSNNPSEIQNNNEEDTNNSSSGFVDRRLDKVFSKTEERIKALKLLKQSTTGSTKESQEEEEEEEKSTGLLTSWPKKVLKPKNMKQAAGNGDDEYAEHYQASSGSEFEPDFNDSDAPEEDEDDGQQNQPSSSPSSSSSATATATATKNKRTLEKRHDESDNDSVFSDMEDTYEEPKAKKPRNFKRNKKAIYKPRPANRKSPWMLFNAEYRQKVTEENEELSGPEIQQRLSEIYHNLPESERERYKKESEEFRKEINEQRHVRERNQKLPGNSYIQYTKFMSPQIKLQHPGIKMQDRNALIAQGWKDLGKEGQQRFVDEAKELMEKFKKENPEYYEAHMKRSNARRRATDEKKKLEKKRVLRKNRDN